MKERDKREEDLDYGREIQKKTRIIIIKKENCERTIVEKGE